MIVPHTTVACEPLHKTTVRQHSAFLETPWHLSGREDEQKTGIASMRANDSNESLLLKNGIQRGAHEKPGNEDLHEDEKSIRECQQKWVVSFTYQKTFRITSDILDSLQTKSRYALLKESLCSNTGSRK